MARAVVTFRSTAFNTDRERDPFINPGNYGDDLARRLIERLRDRGVEADPEPREEDHGWYLKYRVGGEAYCFVVGYRPAGREEEGAEAP